MPENAMIFNADKYAKGTYANFQQVLKAKNALDVSTLGLSRSVDTLTYLVKDVLEAKYYTTPLPLTDYIQINASGEGAYMKDITQYTEAGISASFEECTINPFSTGVHNDSTADVALVSSVRLCARN